MTPKRKKGGQPANTNALKHGFYSHRFNALELKDLGTVTTDNLDDEIALMRVIIRRVFDLADTEAKTLDDWQMALSTLGAASTRLAGMLRTQKGFSGGTSQEQLLVNLSKAIDILNDRDKSH